MVININGKGPPSKPIVAVRHWSRELVLGRHSRPTRQRKPATASDGKLPCAVDRLMRVIAFGEQAVPGGCTHSGTDPGFVCPAGSLTFSPVVATASTGVLTFKPEGAVDGVPANGFGQSGLGANGTAAPAACTNPTCEIGDSNSITVTSSGSPIDDVVIDSVQAGENFTLNNIGLVTVNTNPNCSTATETCSFTFAPVSTLTLTNSTSSGDVLLTEVSLVQGAPEPASLILLGTGLLGLGLLRHRRKKVN